MPRTQPNRAEIPGLIAALQARNPNSNQRLAAALHLGFCHAAAAPGPARKAEYIEMAMLQQRLRAGPVTNQDADKVIAKLQARAQEP